MSRKVRKTLTLDPEVVEVFGADPSALSATVNAVLLEEAQRRARRESLGSFIAELEAEHGKPDPTEVEYFRRLLG